MSNNASPLGNFAFIGVQKAGSTWLYRKMETHPDIFLAEGAEDKDTQFFSYYYDRGHEWYERYFQGGLDAQVRGEVSTSYFPCSDAPRRLARYNPECRLIVCFRNPVDRMISNHNHEMRLGHISEKNYGLDAGIINNPAYIDQSRYFEHLTNWLKYFPLEHIHIIIFEEMFKRPQIHLQELFGFLGVSQAHVPTGLDEKVNKSRVPHSRTLDIILKKTSELVRSAGLGRGVDYLKKRGLKNLVSKVNTDTTLTVNVSPEYREELLAIFHEDNQKLSDLIGKDLSIWNK